MSDELGRLLDELGVPPTVEGARRQAQERAIEAAIDRALAEAPDLRPEQRRTLARLLIVEESD